MSTYAVDLELIEELVTQMGTFERHLEAVRTDVERRAEQVHAVWRGQAAAECRQAHARWRTGAQDMHEALAVLRTIAATAHANYSAAMRANAQMWAL